MGRLSTAANQAMPADNELRTGTVVQLVNPTTGATDGIYVTFTPDASAAPVRCFALVSYTPTVGDVVQVLRQGSAFLILGKAAKRGSLG